MIGMDFVSFVILLVIGVVVSAILHYACKLYVMAGTGSFLSKVIMGWIGAWLGSPVLGHWWEGLNYQQVYFAPAILGAIAIIVLAVDICRTCASVCAGEGSGEGGP